MEPTVQERRYLNMLVRRQVLVFILLITNTGQASDSLNIKGKSSVTTDFNVTTGEVKTDDNTTTQSTFNSGETGTRDWIKFMNKTDSQIRHTNEKPTEIYVTTEQSTDDTIVHDGNGTTLNETYEQITSAHKIQHDDGGTTLNLTNEQTTSDPKIRQNNGGAKLNLTTLEPPPLSLTLSPTSISCDNKESVDAALKKVKDCTTYKPDLYSCHGNCGKKTSAYRHCGCDMYCSVNKDCCSDFQQLCPHIAEKANKIVDSVNDTGIKWSCIEREQRVRVKMITKCPDEANTPCNQYDLDLLEGYMPVFDYDTGQYYLNNFCAKCNNFTDGKLLMPISVECLPLMQNYLNNMEELEFAVSTSACTLKFDELGHQCWNYESTCHPDCENETIKTICETEPVQMYASTNIVYKNEYCAICANDWPGVSWANKHCSSQTNNHHQPIFEKFSFSLLMNINPNKDLTVRYNIGGKEKSFRCNNLTDCNETSCMDRYEFQNDTCVLVYELKSVKVSFDYIISDDLISALDTSSELISFLRDVLSESLTSKPQGKVSYSFSKDFDADSKRLKGSLVAEFNVTCPIVRNFTFQEFHNSTLYDIINSTKERAYKYMYGPFVPELETMIICVDLVNFLTCYDWINDTVLYQRYNPVDQAGMKSTEIEGLVTIVCLGLSIVCMSIRLIFQRIVSIYHTFAGKIQFCFVASLCVAHALYLIGPFVTDILGVCKAIAILIHYFFLVAFTWMGIIALDMYLTFRSTLQDTKGWKRILLYVFMSLMLPAIVISVAIILDTVPNTTHIKPLYGGTSLSETPGTLGTSSLVSHTLNYVRICQMSNPYAVSVFFAGPLGVMIMFNIIMYTLTVLSLKKAWKQTTMVSRTNSCHLYIYIKLFTLMGFTWVFGFIAPFVHEALVYVFIVLNASQGVFIFLTTVCTKAVLKEMKGKCKSERDSSHDTAVVYMKGMNGMTSQQKDDVINSTSL